MQRGVGKLGDVMRRDRGGHADRDSLRAIGKKVRDAGGKKARLFGFPVIGRTEIYRFLVDAVEK